MRSLGAVKAWQSLGALLAVGALLPGCQSSIDGTPATSPQSPTEPSFPTARPTRSSPVPSPSTTAAAPPSTSRAPSGATPLEPENGYVFIETKSGKTRCQLSKRDVGCESDFTDAPVVDGEQANGVRLTSDGQIKWVVGNLGDIPVVTLDYRKYSAVGWTIDASEDGTRISNDSTGHGMTIAVQGVKTF
ncbi:hypothetical protein A5731_16880 [Mycolicibacterium conceptionense]|jgi:hypothetical protein|uniref:LpqJ protein n=2 Tax=Mycolicibacterium TaxID=1866885 RepID=A0A0J8U6G8_9MYCO|nr:MULTISPECIES: hypothetical protein [Mycolicibacterium]KLI05179.1 hypothetical protein AA982_26255 [Mycolicibacterium senegalense]KLO52319.1 hypothetical protein ABW05_13135 [Mycolicibacterium senegalense]KMV16632.1 hypothetical protein ACT17_19645 [Mycolicibacterium conceptionense]MCW1824091.1 hypothetical protein [Mycolicibacterium senegalense]OBB07744.1 hypothetical protein A5718_16555 [Mycolicibacterium conceptionense]